MALPQEVEIFEKGPIKILQTSGAGGLTILVRDQRLLLSVGVAEELGRALLALPLLRAVQRISSSALDGDIDASMAVEAFAVKGRIPS